MKRRSFLAAAVLAVSAHFVRLPALPVDRFAREADNFVLPGESYWYQIAKQGQELSQWIERVALETPPFLARP